MKRPLVAVAILAIAFTVSACGDEPEPVASPTPTPTVTDTPPPASTPTPTPSVTPSFDPHPDLSSLTISTQGLLPLTIGEAPDTNPGAAMLTYDPVHCWETYEMFWGDPATAPEEELARWVPNYPGPNMPFTLDASSDHIYRIDVWSSEITTAGGIGIGSTLSELQAAHPELVEGSFHATAKVWWIADEHGAVVFETQNPTTWDAPVAGSDSVILIRILSNEWDTDWSAANSGDVAGTCPF